MFNFNTNYYELGFNYEAMLQPCVYGGDTVITNSNTQPEFFGSFLTSTPECGMLYSLPQLRSWHSNVRGELAIFRLFKKAPVIAGDFRITAEVAEDTGKVYLFTWRRATSTSAWVKLPYVVRHCVPTITTSLGYSVDLNNTINAPIGTELEIEFGFYICPKLSNLSYNRHSFDKIDFITIPWKAPPRVGDD